MVCWRTAAADWQSARCIQLLLIIMEGKRIMTEEFLLSQSKHFDLGVVFQLDLSNKSMPQNVSSDL